MKKLSFNKKNWEEALRLLPNFDGENTPSFVLSGRPEKTVFHLWNISGYKEPLKPQDDFPLTVM